MHTFILKIVFIIYLKYNMSYNIAINKLIEKIIEIRIKEIDEKTNSNDLLINTNKQIKEEKKKEINIKKIKKNIPDEEKKLTSYTTFIKDSKNIINNRNCLDYLPNDIISRIKVFKDIKPSEQFKELSNIWNSLDMEIKEKYIKLCQDKNFTNSKYNDLIDKKKQKQPRKKGLKII